MISDAWGWLTTLAAELAAGGGLARALAGSSALALAGVLLVVILLRRHRRTSHSGQPRQGAGRVAPSAAAPSIVAEVAREPAPSSPPVQLAEIGEGLVPVNTAERPIPSGPLFDHTEWRIASGPLGLTQPAARQGATTVPLTPIAAVALAERNEAAGFPGGIAMGEVWEAPARERGATAPLAEPTREERAQLDYLRGLRLLARTDGDREAALRDALACFRRALQSWTREAAPERWAAVHNDIGRVYQELPGNRTAHVRTAIMYHQTALEVFDPVKHAMNWAWTQAALGAAYQALPSGSSVGNARAALAYLQRALDIFTRENAPLAWAWNLTNLGAAHETLRDQVEGERLLHLREAARCYADALSVYTAAAYPTQHQVAARNLARVEAELGKLDG